MDPTPASKGKKRGAAQKGKGKAKRPRADPTEEGQEAQGVAAADVDKLGVIHYNCLKIKASIAELESKTEIERAANLDRVAKILSRPGSEHLDPVAVLKMIFKGGPNVEQAQQQPTAPVQAEASSAVAPQVMMMPAQGMMGPPGMPPGSMAMPNGGMGAGMSMTNGGMGARLSMPNGGLGAMLSMANGGMGMATGGMRMANGGMGMATGGMPMANGGMGMAGGRMGAPMGGMSMPNGGGRSMPNGGMVMGAGGMTMGTSMGSGGMAAGGQTYFMGEQMWTMPNDA